MRFELKAPRTFSTIMLLGTINRDALLARYTAPQKSIPLIRLKVVPSSKEGMGLARLMEGCRERLRLRAGAPMHGATLGGSGAVGRRRHRTAGPSFAFLALSRSIQMYTRTV